MSYRHVLDRVGKFLGMKNLHLLRQAPAHMPELVRFARIAPGLMYTMELRDNRLAMTYLSPAVEDIFGVSVEDGLADFDNLKSRVVPEDADAMRDLSEKSRRTLSPFHAQYRILHPTKGERWLEANSMPEVPADGVIQWHGFITDITERKHTEAVLATSEREFRALARHLPDTVVRYDRDARFVYANPVFEKRLGMRLEDVLGKTPTEVPGLPEAEWLEQRVRIALQTGFMQEFERQIQTVDGRSCWGLVHIVPELDDARQVAFVQVVARDITELKQAVNDVEDTRRFLNQMLESLPSPWFLKDREHRWVMLNEALCQMLGRSREELIGKSDFDFFPEHEAREFWDKDEIVFGSGLEHLNEEPLTDGEGKTRTILTRKNRFIDASGQMFLMGSIADITEHKLYERYLKQISVFQTIPDLVWLKDAEGIYLACNHAFEEFFGASEAEIVGNTDYDFVDAGLADFFRQKDNDAMAADHVCINEEWVAYAGGSRRVLLETRKMPVHGDDGNIIGVLGIGRDITERWNLQKVLEAREREFRTLIENAPDNIIRYGPDTRILYVNSALQKTLGRQLEALIGKRPDELYPDIPAMVEYQALLERVIANGQPEEYLMVSGLDRFGRPLYDNIRIAPEFSPGGEVIGAIAIGRDLTRQHQLETELIAREHEFRTLVENTPDVIIRYDRDCRRTYVSRNYEQVYGNPVAQALGKKPTESWGRPRMNPAEYEARLRAVMESGVSDTIELDWVGDAGEYVCQALRVVPEFDDTGQVAGTLSITRDVSEIKRATSKLQMREREYRTLVDQSPEMVIRYNRECRRIFVNQAYERVSGLTQADALGKPLAESWVPRNISSEEFSAQLRQVMKSGEPTNIILEWPAKDGTLISHDLRAVPEYDDLRQVSGVLAIGHNISRFRQAEIVLRQREQEFRALVENSPDTICRYDHDCRRVYANSRMLADANVPLEELLYKTPEEFPGGEQAAAFQIRVQHVIESGEPDDFELTWQAGVSKEICTHLRLVPEFNAEGRVATVLAVGRDITEIDAYRKQIHTMAFYDKLTMLPNRALLGDRIRQTQADATWHRHNYGLMILDLDRFKDINDTLGHGVGDQVLREAAARLQTCVRSYDSVARLGGDEFAILLPEIRGAEDLSMLARKMLDSFDQPFTTDGRELFVSASIGIALFPTDSSDIDTLFRFADSAMYHAKRQGRNNFQFYSSELTARTAERMSIGSALRKALTNNELELYYQPQVHLGTGRLVGAEALLRWNRDGKEIITPDRFIPISEETGLIIGIGEWVLETACRAAVEWNRDRIEALQVAINLSTRQFIMNDLVSTLRTIMADTGCRPDWIKLEITESLLLDDSRDIADALNAFDKMGLKISIDDFGTGYSALAYLNRFPVSQIKIDCSFVRDIPHDRDKSELVKAMISIAKSLRLDLVAEGVETQQQASYLLAHGCRTAQGYLFGKPMPRIAFEGLMASSKGGDVIIEVPSPDK